MYWPLDGRPDSGHRTLPRYGDESFIHGLSKRTEFVISDDNDVFFLSSPTKVHRVVVFSNPFKMTGRLGFGGHRDNPRRRTESEFRAPA